MNLNEKFMTEISNIKEPEVFLGVARLLGARLFDEEEKTTRNFVDIFADVMESYSKRDRKMKREILKVLNKANRARKASEEDINGNSTENSEG